MKTKGHRANAPGLRGHSCGDLYPLTIVGTNFGRSWYVMDCLSGEVGDTHTSQRRAERDARITLALRAERDAPGWRCWASHVRICNIAKES